MSDDTLPGKNGHLLIVLKKNSSGPKTPKIDSILGLARYLRLSEWTVSRAINGHPEVKAATRKRILQTMGEVGFRPNPVARGLSGKAMGLVGVCFGNTHHAIMVDKITLLDQFLRDHDLRAILAISPKDETGELRVLEDFRHLRVDGIVLFQTFLSTAQIQAVLSGAHCVHVEPPHPEMFPSVTLDRGKAMRLIIDHLVDLGHRSFGILGFSHSNRLRWEGIVQGFRDHGIDRDRQVQIFELEQVGLESYAEGIQLAKLALRAKKCPTAYIAINDQVAAGAMQEIREAGYEVPADFSIVGFDNLQMGRYLHPTITTIDQQPHLLISHAGQLLLELLGKSPKTSQSRALCVEPLLIIRESTGPARRRIGRSR